REPQVFPASFTSCLTSITGEKDGKRRAKWLAKAGVQENKSKIKNIWEFRVLAAKLVPHLPRFGAVYKKKSAAAAPRDVFGKFTHSNTQRGARGRVKRIRGRDEQGRIAKNPRSSDFI